MDGDDVGMLETAGESGFRTESCEAQRIRGEVRRQELDGDMTTDRTLDREPDDTHSSAGNFPDEFVIAEALGQRLVC